MAKEEEVTKLGRTFRGVILPTGPRGEAKTVTMYVAVAQAMSDQGDENIVTPDCASLRELREQIDRLKADLDWLYEEMERKLRNMRK